MNTKLANNAKKKCFAFYPPIAFLQLPQPTFEANASNFLLFSRLKILLSSITAVVRAQLPRFIESRFLPKWFHQLETNKLETLQIFFDKIKNIKIHMANVWEVRVAFNKNNRRTYQVKYEQTNAA